MDFDLENKNCRILIKNDLEIIIIKVVSLNVLIMYKVTF